MKYFYDRKADSLYLTFAERAYGDSMEVAAGVVLDFDRQGRLIGIDLEHASTIVDVADLALHEQPVGTDIDAAIVTGKTLKQDREALGLSQAELGRKLSVSANTIARWERGELKIEHPAMLQLALTTLRGTSEKIKTTSTAGLIAPHSAFKGRDKQRVARSTISGQFVESKTTRSSRSELRRAKKK